MTKQPLQIDIIQADLSSLDYLVQANIDLALETEGLTLDRDTVILGTRAVLDDTTKGVYLLAVHKGETIGSMLITKEWSDWRNNNNAWIQSLFVQQPYRSQGVFKQLFKEVERQCALGVYSGVRLYADKKNEKAIKVYQDFGMNDEHYIFFEKMNQ
eukprot:GHVN01047727.1.p2 GENE.GHVN01047727.1~~GHVN01047727.1.p2  ORF type:complete len:156 (-),score=25.07 GHVN01047727.1:1653-2120(-)